MLDGVQKQSRKQAGRTGPYLDVAFPAMCEGLLIAVARVAWDILVLCATKVPKTLQFTT